MTPQNDPLFEIDVLLTGPLPLPPESYQFKSHKKKGRRKVVDQNVRERGDYCWTPEGKPYVRVTSVLDVVDKPFLDKWRMKQVYLAMLADPTMSVDEAMAAPERASADKRKKGVTVHSIIQTYCEGKTLDEALAGIPDEYKGYITGFYGWMREKNVRILEQEQVKVSDKYGYGGRPDILALVGDNTLPIVVDVKTTKAVWPESFLQTSAYCKLYREYGVETLKGATLALKADGSTPLYVEADRDYFREFFAALVLWQWQHADDLDNLMKHVKTNGGNGNGKARVPVSGS